MKELINITKVNVFKEDTEDTLRELTLGMQEANVFYNLNIVEGECDSKFDTIEIG